MAQYDKETKFYWLQLKEDFFEDDAIEWLEEQKPNGRDYAYFYLKLCLKSLKSNGILIRQVGNILIPYDNKKLAELTRMDFDTVTVAMELLKQIGLIKILENGEIYLTQLENLIGSVSKGALKKQQQRMGIKERQNQLEWTESGQVSTKVKDKVKDKDKVKVNNITCYEKLLSTNKYEIITGNFRLEEAIKDWLRYKQERKELYKEIGLQSLLTQIEKQATTYGEQQVIDLITECMANNYKGIIFDKLKNKPKRKQGVEPEWLGKEIKKEKYSDETERLYREVFGDSEE